ncbi:MAG: hypothetical protein LBM70_09075 [Victivallales bacterium]|jgi:hypothetical protein|nr:hypothetical protein [Victivallales bacterium]
MNYVCRILCGVAFAASISNVAVTAVENSSDSDRGASIYFDDFNVTGLFVENWKTVGDARIAGQQIFAKAGRWFFAVNCHRNSMPK